MMSIMKASICWKTILIIQVNCTIILLEGVLSLFIDQKCLSRAQTPILVGCHC